ncbi:hypothetical protein Tco_0935390 [Tanacetum coccineum]
MLNMGKSPVEEPWFRNNVPLKGAKMEPLEPGFELKALKTGQMGLKWVVRLEYLLWGFKAWTLYFNSASWDFLDQKLASIVR